MTKTLIERVQDEEDGAFTEFMTIYESRVTQVVVNLIDDQHEVEDIVQETFFKAYMGIHNFRGDSDVFTWLYRIAVNNCKNRLLSKKRKMLRYGLDAKTTEEDETQNHSLLIDETPEDVFMSNELEGLIADSIENLHPELREAITLRDIQGLSYTEIADIVGVAVGTVRSRIFRAREAVSLEILPYVWRR